MNVTVLKVSAGKAAVIADNGEFMTIPAKDGMKEGAAFEFTPQKKTWKRNVIAIAASLLLCVLGLGAFSTFTPASYIDININPGVRLAVNQWGSVISAEAINEDGVVLINEVNVPFLQEPGTSVKQIIGRAWKDGTLKASGHILLTISDDDLQRAQNTEMKLMVSALETVKEAGLSVDITLQKLDSESFGALREEQAALDDKGKSGVYSSDKWRSGKNGLYIEKAEYTGNGVIEIEFSGEVLFTGSENITVENLSGVRYSVKVKETGGDKLLLQCGGLKEDTIYKITVNNIGEAGKILSSYLYINLLGTESENQYNQPYPDDRENSGEDTYNGNDNGDETEAESQDTDDTDDDSELDGGEEEDEDTGDTGGGSELEDDEEEDDGPDAGDTDDDDEESDDESGDEEEETSD